MSWCAHELRGIFVAWQSVHHHVVSSWSIKTAAVEAESLPSAPLQGVREGSSMAFPRPAPLVLVGPLKAGGVQLLAAFRGKGGLGLKVSFRAVHGFPHHVKNSSLSK